MRNFIRYLVICSFIFCANTVNSATESVAPSAAQLSYPVGVSSASSNRLTKNLREGKRIIVCVAGGTGAGKTAVAQKIYNSMKDNAVLISQDSYYKDLSHLPEAERAKTNFDHPNSLDFVLLKKQLLELQNGNNIVVPIYDFKTHTRTAQTNLVKPKQIIIVEGILLLAVKELQNTYDLKVFVDVDDDIRLLRRINRDMSERNRTFESISKQYLTTVKPMHKEFVEPSKYLADIIVPSWGENNIAIKMIVDELKFNLKHS